MAELDLSGGGMTALTGPSGSGKTTLLYLLSGLMLPTSGTIRWAGDDLTQMTEGARDRWRRQRAGFMFQDFQLVPELSPLENTLLPARFAAFRAGTHRTRARDLLQTLGVPERARAGLLSRGEQQRVALARALLMQPGVIFADEPTASLDSEAGAGVIALLADLARGQGRSIVVASHDPALIARADQRLMLQRGAEVRLT